MTLLEYITIWMLVGPTVQFLFVRFAKFPYSLMYKSRIGAWLAGPAVWLVLCVIIGFDWYRDWRSEKEIALFLKDLERNYKLRDRLE